jgi:hypothetical protein
MNREKQLSEARGRLELWQERLEKSKSACSAALGKMKKLSGTAKKILDSGVGANIY